MRISTGHLRDVKFEKSLKKQNVDIISFKITMSLNIFDFESCVQ